MCPLTYNILPNEISNWNGSLKRKTDSTEITIQDKEYKLISTTSFATRAMGGSWDTKHLWIPQVGTAHWFLDYDDRYTSSSGKKEVSEFVLQSFNGIPIPRINFMAINPRVMSKTQFNPANQVFQKILYLTGNRTTSKPFPLNSYFTIQGQKVIMSKSSQLFVNEKS